MVANASGKKLAINIRKIAGLSPIWNQRMAKGIQANGERKRKKFSMGVKAFLAYRCCPSHNPAGMPKVAEITNPTATRHREAITSLIKRPALISSRRLFHTAPGEGKA